jgi:formylglycine-generating enzyme required for sulfatase activity
MIGNVAEWCRDGYAHYCDSVPLPGDGMRHWATSPDAARIYRGSSFNVGHFGTSSRPATRAGARLEYIGLRPARVLQQERR